MYDEKLGQKNHLNPEQGLNQLSAPAHKPNTLASYPLDSNPMALSKVTGREVQLADNSAYGAYGNGQPGQYQGQYPGAPNYVPAPQYIPAPQYTQQQPQSYNPSQGTSPDAFFGSLQQNAAAVRERMQQGAQHYQPSGPATEADLQQQYLEAQQAKFRAQQSRYDTSVVRDQGHAIRDEQRIIGGNMQLQERDYRFQQRQRNDVYRNQNSELGVERNRYRYGQQQTKDAFNNRKQEANTGYVEDTVDLKTLDRNIGYGVNSTKKVLGTVNQFMKTFGGK